MFLQNGTIVDSMMYIRKKHGKGVFTCHKKKDPAQERLFKQKLEIEKQQEILAQQQVKTQQDLQNPARGIHLRDKAVIPGIPPYA